MSLILQDIFVRRLKLILQDNSLEVFSSGWDAAYNGTSFHGMKLAGILVREETLKLFEYWKYLKLTGIVVFYKLLLSVQ